MKLNEELKDVPGFEGLYSASRDGKIWSIRQNKWLSPRISNKRYKNVSLYDHNKIRKGYTISRLIAATFLDLDLNNRNIEVDHKNSDTLNDSVENLRLLSHHNNMLAYRGRLETDTKAHKLCVKCDKIKLRSEFGINRHNVDKLMSWCKGCWFLYRRGYKNGV